ncbi:hypothetical protein [Algoriphagus sp. CAU 1675]|uniref:hypothetical protein n=1 Tax=Algoriphagus sp. CAU 1675 TaxID=3032597 RepID=UPI0023DAB8C3|nr:hypothetical protein [Algoriphagus sp. CAU 1675]MDF2156253.1 hypothetical protein [Algoriphagus sp. CAU 1675]
MYSSIYRIETFFYRKDAEGAKQDAKNIPSHLSIKTIPLRELLCNLAGLAVKILTG